MQNRRRFLATTLAAATLTLAAAPALAARPAVAIVPHDNIPVVTTAAHPPVDAVKNAIIRAGGQHDWTIRPESPGVLSASLNVRNKHFAVVTIKYNADSYSITYRESTNLEYRLSDGRGPADPPAGTPMIHPNYNRWVENLIRDINAELRRL